MHYSYWELKTWFADVDFTVVGSGIVGLNCALRLRQLFPEKKILILEKGILPQGASTKNAGFACFGSLSEIIDDLNKLSESEVLDLIIKRDQGLNFLRNLVGDATMDYKQSGGYELFFKSNTEDFLECESQLGQVNLLLKSYFKTDVFKLIKDPFLFQNSMPQLIYNPFEGQIDTGKMMDALLKKAQVAGVKIINNIKLETFQEHKNGVDIKCDGVEFKTKQLLIATNGFASKMGIEEVNPARAQVLITKPIKDLRIKGTFHINKGYYYFRNVENRILFGGGRELDFKAETTTQFGLTETVQNKLEEILSEVILPHTPYEIEHRWSGIMGVGHDKKPIVKSISEHVHCGVKLGGMGIAIGSLIGKELAELV